MEIKRRCLNRVFSNVFEVCSPMAEEESDGGFPWVFRCVPAVSFFVTVVPDVPASPSMVSVLGEAVFFRS